MAQALGIVLTGACLAALSGCGADGGSSPVGEAGAGGSPTGTGGSRPGAGGGTSRGGASATGGTDSGDAFFVVIEPLPNEIVEPDDLPENVDLSTRARLASRDGSVIAGTSTTIVSPESRFESRGFSWTRQGGAADLGYFTGDPLTLLSVVPSALSADGRVVSGSFGPGGTQNGLFRWTAAEGMRSLGELAMSGSLSVLGASLDGGVVVANAGGSALRWTQAGGLIALEGVPGAAANYAQGMSADGRALFGISGELYRWNETTGSSIALPAGAQSCAFARNGIADDGSVAAGVCTLANEDRLPFLVAGSGDAEILERVGDHTSHSIEAISRDGSVLLGVASMGSGAYEAFRWTRETGSVGLGVVPGVPEARAIDFVSSADAEVLAGQSRSSGVSVAFRYAPTSGITLLAPLAGNDAFDNAVSDISEDGSLIVGTSGGQAVVWDEDGSVQSVAALLEGTGVDLGGFELTVFSDEGPFVSAVGGVVYGASRDPNGALRAWVARLP